MKEFNRLNIVVNNAGVNRTKPAVEVTEDDWDFIFDVNTKGLFSVLSKQQKL